MLIVIMKAYIEDWQGEWVALPRKAEIPVAGIIVHDNSANRELVMI